MKNLFFYASLLLVLLTGCGVDKEEYDKVVNERDALCMQVADQKALIASMADSIKTGVIGGTVIPAAKYKVGDIAYIAFIINPNASTSNLRDSDIKVKEVRIQSIRLSNGYSMPGFVEGLYLEDKISKMSISYQYVDSSIPDPKVRDCSKEFYSESRFSDTKEGAIKALKK